MAEIIPPQRNEAWLNPDNTPTLRFAEFIESLTTGANEAVTNITTIDDGVSNSAYALAGENEKRLDELAATIQAPLLARIGHLEKALSNLADSTIISPVAKIGQLEQKISDMEASMITPMTDKIEQNTEQALPYSAIGALEKRINFLEGNM